MIGTVTVSPGIAANAALVKNSMHNVSMIAMVFFMSVSLSCSLFQDNVPMGKILQQTHGVAAIHKTVSGDIGV